jgi:dTDP-4-dehydrorhamnose reductase
MKLLVTGGTGFLGRRTAEYFSMLGWQVFTPSHSDLDITSPDAVTEWFRQNAPAAVIHTAAISDTGLCQQNPEWSEAVNVAGCVHLARACQKAGAKLVICSSDQVYFRSAFPGPHKETEAVTPGNVYGRQKLRAEEQCLEILPEAVCLRLSWMYARDREAGEKGDFLSSLLSAMADPSHPLCWPVYDRRGLTDAEEVVKNLPKALELPGGVWNFGSANDLSTYDTVCALLANHPALVRLTPNEAAFRDAPRDLSMNPAKLNAAGIRFPTTLESLQKAI